LPDLNGSFESCSVLAVVFLLYKKRAAIVGSPWLIWARQICRYQRAGRHCRRDLVYRTNRDIAEHQISNYITFSPDARERLVTLAQGHPYMVHLVGKYALRRAFTEQDDTIDSSDIDDTLKAIAERF
jgi:hypothetical protein